VAMALRAMYNNMTLLVSMAAKKEAILAVEREPLVGLRSGLRQVQQ
jgi:hypothetical protein